MIFYPFLIFKQHKAVVIEMLSTFSTLDTSAFFSESVVSNSIAHYAFTRGDLKASLNFCAETFPHKNCFGKRVKVSP